MDQREEIHPEAYCEMIDISKRSFAQRPLVKSIKSFSMGEVKQKKSGESGGGNISRWQKTP
jgi:hypothetical protein